MKSEPRLIDHSWLMDFKEFFGTKVDLLLEARTDNTETLIIDYGDQLPAPIHIIIHKGTIKDGAWRETLNRQLNCTEWKTCLVNVLSTILRLRCEINIRTFADEAAFTADLLNDCLPDRQVAILAPLSLIISQKHESWREMVSTNHRIEGIAYFGASGAELIHAFPIFPFIILLLRTGPKKSDEPVVSRLINLRDSPRTEWMKIISLAWKRQGGEVNSSIVLRNENFDSRPWTYERFSKQFQEIRKDAGQIGTLRPLEDLVLSFQIGLQRNMYADRIRELSATENPSDGYWPCFGGRSIESDGKLHTPVYEVMGEGLPEEMSLHPGDILVRSLVALRSDRKPVISAVVDEHQVPASFDSRCIRIRFKKEVPSDTIQLINSYLNSKHTNDWLVANGVGITLNASLLRRLEVPEPSQELRKALQLLTEAECQYRQWAEQVAETRQGLFATTSFASHVSILLARQRSEIDRLQAARDSDTLDYQIRNYYPHPIALRWELVAQSDLGKPRIEEVLDCAEHFMMLLGILALLQDTTVDKRGPVWTYLKSVARKESLSLDWGKCFSLLQHAIRFMSSNRNPLALQFPELIELNRLMSDEKSEWSIAEKFLRTERNNKSHLQRIPEVELMALSEKCHKMLHSLLEGASFMAAFRLVHNRDYHLDSTTSKRYALFEMLKGISPAFQRQEIEVNAEVPRGVLGFLNRKGDFVSTMPWLIYDTCQKCKRSEIFAFSRLENGSATYVAMETGHPQQKELLAKNIIDLLRA